jgi:hypothetical protein
MDKVFQLIGSNMAVSWDPEELAKDFKVIIDDNNNIVSLPSGEAHWQYFNSGIYFSRNFDIEFPKQCHEVISSLIEIQDQYRKKDNNSDLVNLFLKHKIRIDRLVLIKVVSGQHVDLHYDRNRSFSINIGLKNSSTCLTHVYSGERVEDTFIDEKNVKHTYQMNDGDAYIIATCQPHSVESLTYRNESKDRYILSYSL